MTTGEKIRSFGAQKFDSIKEFAEALGIAASNLQDYMNDKYAPGPKMLARLRALGCDLNWLFDDDENPPPRDKLLEVERQKRISAEEEVEKLKRLFNAQAQILAQIENLKKKKKK